MSDPPSFEKYTSEELTNVYHILRAPRRRLLILLFLQDALPDCNSPKLSWANNDESCSISVREVSRKITAIEQGVTLDHATGSAYHSVYTSLTQTHLPLLDEANIISYNADRQTFLVKSNVVPVAIIAEISTPVSHMLLDEGSLSQLVRNGYVNLEDSIGD